MKELKEYKSTQKLKEFIKEEEKQNLLNYCKCLEPIFVKIIIYIKVIYHYKKTKFYIKDYQNI